MVNRIEGYKLRRPFAFQMLGVALWSFVAFAQMDGAIAQQTQPTKPQIKPPRNVLHLPKVAVSEDRGNIAPKSLPSVKTPMRLTGSILIESDDDDLLLPEGDLIPTEQATPSTPKPPAKADVPTPNPPKSSNSVGEGVTPVPVQPNDQFDANWIQRNGGERLPPKRQLFDLNGDKAANGQAPIPNPPKATNDPVLQTPSNTSPAPLPDSVPNSEGSSARQEYSSGNELRAWEQTTAQDWSDFPRLLPTLSERLNYVQHNQDQSNMGLIPSPEPVLQEDWSQQNFPRLLNGAEPVIASDPPPAMQPGFLQQRVNERLLYGAPDQYASNQNYFPDDFAPTIVTDTPHNTDQQLQPYYGKHAVATQRPLIELGRPFYGDGIFSPAIPLFSDVNPLTPQFLLYGDYRAGVGVHRNNGQPVRSIANRLALEMDLRVTGTERFHALMAPLDHNGRFTRLDFSDSSDVSFQREMDAQFDTAFFEGDLGAIVGGMTGDDAPFDLPIAAGLMPMLYQNGIWMEDIVAGVAVSLPWRHSTKLNWANYDATFFALFDQITSPAFLNQNSRSNAFGTAWFIEAYDGYIEADYAYMLDTVDSDLSYHNTALAYTRRYFERVSNSIRVINNVGQGDLAIDRTADGTLFIMENSLVTSKATTVIPYANFFYGVRRPQSVARAAAAGGILRNTGILFESDNLTGYPTLDATGNSSYGGAFGLNLFASNFRRQLVVEFAALDTYGDQAFSTAAGPQYGFGTRYQHALTNWTLLRLDAMVGWRDRDSDIFGTRAEWRWKF